MKSRGQSRISGLHRLTVPERVARIQSESGVDLTCLAQPISIDLADRMIENTVGALSLPVGVATNFQVNGRDLFVPMAIEEPSVIAAASNAARMARNGGGFQAESDPSHTVAQIEVLGVDGVKIRAIEAHADALLEMANAASSELVSLGGGARELIVRPEVGTPERAVVHLVVDCLDAMGANTVNTMAEAIAPEIERLSSGRVGLKILTNLADRRLVRARCRIPAESLVRDGFSGSVVAASVAAASDFAAADPYRAATHNKGIFNGIDPVLIATGNDWRAVEAGGHAYAARRGRYEPLATWAVDGEHLAGIIELPMAVGIVGGASRTHPAARGCLELLGVETAAELGEVVAAVGLATNLAALAALSSEGIQRGHMRLHSRKNS